MISLIVTSAAAVAAEGQQHGLPQQAVEIARPFGFPVTNSMVVTWIVALGLIAFAQLATRRMKEVPDGLQNFLEWLIEGLYRFLEGILGPHLVRRTFWFFGTIFIYPRRQLGGAGTRDWLDWLGASDAGGIPARRAPLPR